MKDSPQIILGIDPGTLVMGYGAIAVNKGKVSLLEMGVLNLSKYEDHARRLQLIYEKMQALLHNHKPTSVAIEAPFFGKNVQSMLKLGRAQGVAIAAAMQHGLPAVEYAPRKVKQSVTGKGNATKEQVWEMLQLSLAFKGSLRYLDASDAVAVAFCHYLQTRVPETTQVVTPVKKLKTKKSSWASFIQENPGRVK